VRVLPIVLLASAAGASALAAGPGSLFQTALRGKLFSALKPEQQKGLAQTASSDQIIARMDLQQRQGAAGRLPALEPQFPDPESLNEIGSVYLKLGALDQAARLAEALKAKHPGDPRGPLLEARAKAESGDKEGALAAAKQAVMLDPSNGEAMAYLKLLRDGGTRSSRVALPGSPPSPRTEPAGHANPTMDPDQRRRVNNALAVLMTSPNGKRILLAVVPNAEGAVTEADLEKHGVLLRMTQVQPEGGNFGGVSSAAVKGRGQIVIIGFNSAVIDERNAPQEMAAFFGGEIDQAGYQDKTGWRLPSILLNWRKRAAHAYILIDLKVEAFATRASSVFSREMRLDARVLEGNIAQKKTRDGVEEYFGGAFDDRRESLAISEDRWNVKGVDLISILNGFFSNNQTDIQLNLTYPDYSNQKKSVSTDLRRDFQSP